jgi:16S rRNA (cytosine967-C5)-methyltransferase
VKNEPPLRVRYLKALWEKYHSCAQWYQFDKWIEQEYKKNPSFGKRDRRWYSEYLFSALRFFELAKKILPEDEFNSNAFWKLIEVRAGLGNVFESSIAEEKLKAFGEPGGNLSLFLTWNGIPAKWENVISERAKASGWDKEKLSQFISFLGQRAPMWIRVNQKKDLPSVKAELLQAKFQIIEEDDEALCIEGSKSLKGLECFVSGLIELQDWASQQIVNSLESAVDFSKINSIWDACAGGGGKTLQLGSKVKEFKNSGVEISASDIRENKLVELKRRALKANLKNVQSFVWQGEVLLREFDLVLVDAPCTSSGVMRRNPELRVKIDPGNTTEINALQLKLLSSASQSVKAGGKLCYGTCSFFYSENEGIVETFSKQHPNFRLLKKEMHGIPNRNSDTTFSAIWERKKD